MNDYKEEYGRGWIGVDLDGTLAEYDGWKGPEHIGKPLMPMVRRVKKWLKDGREVRILTARVCPDIPEGADNSVERATDAIDRWCIQVFGQILKSTSMKNYNMVELWDDRAIPVEFNTGRCLYYLDEGESMTDPRCLRVQELQIDHPWIFSICTTPDDPIERVVCVRCHGWLSIEAIKELEDPSRCPHCGYPTPAPTVIDEPANKLHDDHYKSKGIEPITVQEQTIEIASVPRRSALCIAQAIRYLMRAGSKNGEPWERDVEKAFNYLHRALNGTWMDGRK